MAYRMAQGINWDDFDEGLKAVNDIGPGGHYLGHPHTLNNFQRAFFMPELFDNNSIEQWQAEGAIEITERALMRALSVISIAPSACHCSIELLSNSSGIKKAR